MAKKKRIIKVRKKKPKPSDTIMVALKMSRSELVAIKKRAAWYAKGNLSAWLRHSGLRYKPKRGEVVLSVAVPVKKKTR